MLESTNTVVVEEEVVQYLIRHPEAVLPRHLCPGKIVYAGQLTVLRGRMFDFGSGQVKLCCDVGELYAYGCAFAFTTQELEIVSELFNTDCVWVSEKDTPLSSLYLHGKRMGMRYEPLLIMMRYLFCDTEIYYTDEPWQKPARVTELIQGYRSKLKSRWGHPLRWCERLILPHSSRPGKAEKLLALADEYVCDMKGLWERL